MSESVERSSGWLFQRCRDDGEFRLAARHWTGGLRFEMGERVVGMSIADGTPVLGEPGQGGVGVVTLSAAAEIWDLLLAARPPRLCNDISPLIAAGRMTLDADRVVYAQYYPAIMRAVELLRPAGWEVGTPPPTSAAYDSPVGRYVHLVLEGQRHRVYFEEAGAGIPMLLQHTAGAHGAQWRHLFECKTITDHFRLIAYDLPYHGKSLPPIDVAWWRTPYRLQGSFLRSVPLALSAALGLERPVFMGCSVGGLLALDLARRHAAAFRAVISLEGALKIEGTIASLGMLWHPQVGNDYKARLMNAVMSPTSPEAFRRETSYLYASGWPPAFLGDLQYYLDEYDLRQEAARIDTGQVAVHILSGEYDPSGTLERGRAAHEAIPGSTWTPMMGVGHFPMSENPEAFVGYLLPVLKAIRRGAA
jgi:pimeloyl-ACP methyl ester carboxylesterase